MTALIRRTSHASTNDGNSRRDLAATFATALPAPAADRPGDAGTDGPGAVLAGLLAQNSGGIFEADDDDRRIEQAARLCLEHAEDKVRDNGGDSADFDRVVDAETDGDRVRLLADMSADYDGDRRSARVECEVDFDGDNEVTAFRQLGEAGGVLGGILSRDDELEGDLGGDGRREQAAASASTMPKTRSGTTVATMPASTAWSTPRESATRSASSPT